MSKKKMFNFSIYALASFVLLGSPVVLLKELNCSLVSAVKSSGVYKVPYSNYQVDKNNDFASSCNSDLQNIFYSYNIDEEDIENQKRNNKEIELDKDFFKSLISLTSDNYKTNIFQKEDIKTKSRNWNLVNKISGKYIEEYINLNSFEPVCGFCVEDFIVDSSVTFKNGSVNGIVYDKPRKGDIILSVNGVTFAKASDYTKEQLKKEIESNFNLELEFLRKNTASGNKSYKPMRFKVSRKVKQYDEYRRKLVSLKKIQLDEDDIVLLIELNNVLNFETVFYITEFLKYEYDKLNNNKRIKSIIFDFRKCSEGCFGAAQKLAGLFLPKGTSFATYKSFCQDGLVTEITNQQTQPFLSSAPLDLCCIIDETTSGAAAHCASILRNFKNAPVLGRKNKDFQLEYELVNININDEKNLENCRLIYPKTGFTVKVSEEEEHSEDFYDYFDGSVCPDLVEDEAYDKEEIYNLICNIHKFKSNNQNCNVEYIVKKLKNENKISFDVKLEPIEYHQNNGCDIKNSDQPNYFTWGQNNHMRRFLIQKNEENFDDKKILYNNINTKNETRTTKYSDAEIASFELPLRFLWSALCLLSDEFKSPNARVNNLFNNTEKIFLQFFLEHLNIEDLKNTFKILQNENKISSQFINCNNPGQTEFLMMFSPRFGLYNKFYDSFKENNYKTGIINSQKNEIDNFPLSPKSSIDEKIQKQSNDKEVMIKSSNSKGESNSKIQNFNKEGEKFSLFD